MPQMREPNGKFAKKNSTSANKPAITKGNPANFKGKGKKVTPTSLTNRFALCLDASGSMRSIKETAYKCFLSNIETIKENAVKTGQKSTVSVITFGDKAAYDYLDYDFNKCTIRAENVDPTKYSVDFEYKTEGNTPLYDGIGLAIERFELLGSNDPNTSFVVMVVTDGDENRSVKYKQDDIRSAIKRLQATGNWSFVFLVPPRRRSYVSNTFDISIDNVKEWEATNAGVTAAAFETNSAIGEFYTTRSAGATQTSSFYSTNADDLTKKEVKATLKNVEDDYWSLNVSSYEDGTSLKERITSQGLKFKRGCNFYQLTKKETIQANKSILLMDKADPSKVYGGDEARSLLGLPNYTLPVVPGDHGKWIIFVQSNSTNRKLVAGTKVLVKK